MVWLARWWGSAGSSGMVGIVEVENCSHHTHGALSVMSLFLITPKLRIHPWLLQILLAVLPAQDIGEAEAGELVRLYRPLLEGCVAELLSDVDLTTQGVSVEGLDLKELVGGSCYGVASMQHSVTLHS